MNLSKKGKVRNYTQIRCSRVRHHASDTVAGLTERRGRHARKVGKGSTREGLERWIRKKGVERRRDEMGKVEIGMDTQIL